MGKEINLQDYLKIDIDKIVKVISGKASPEEVSEMTVWMSESEENQAQFKTIKNVWEVTGLPDPGNAPSSEKMWKKIEKRINRNDQSKDGFDFSWIIKIAAMLLLTLSGILLFQHVTSIRTTEKQTASVMSKPPVLAKNTLVTASGQKLTCVLPDGSIVYLNSDSKIVFPKNFEGDTREVGLIGEAFFSVQPDKSRPFIVMTGYSKVTVTGTEFNVRNRNKKTSVVVAKGSVNVLSIKLKKEERLKAGEMVEIVRSGNITPPSTANLKYALAWRQNKLAFNHATLNEVMSEIERTFDVKAEFLDHSSRTRTITGIFDTDSLDKILKVISITLDINITQKGMKIIIQ